MQCESNELNHFNEQAWGIYLIELPLSYPAEIVVSYIWNMDVFF